MSIKLLEACASGVSSTLISFIVLGNYGLGLQMTRKFDVVAFLNSVEMSIIAAFPIAMVIILIIASFIKDAKKYIKEEKKQEPH